MDWPSLSTRVLNAEILDMGSQSGESLLELAGQFVLCELQTSWLEMLFRVSSTRTSSELHSSTKMVVEMSAFSAKLPSETLFFFFSLLL